VATKPAKVRTKMRHSGSAGADADREVRSLAKKSQVMMINLNNMANQKQGRWLRMVAHARSKAKIAATRSPFLIRIPTCTPSCFCSAFYATPSSVSTISPPAGNSLRLSGLSTPCAVLLGQWWQRNEPRPCGPLAPLKLWNTGAGN
jgi:hypothetical protein